MAHSRERITVVLVALLAVAIGACGDDPSGPRKTADVTLAVVSVEGPTVNFAGDNRVSVSCEALLRATAKGEGIGTWQGGTLLFYAGRDRSEPLDSIPITAEEAASFWQSDEVQQGTTLFGQFVLTASVPFAVTARFEYLPAPRSAPKTAEASITCGPTLAEGAAGPTITAVTVDPPSGAVEPGQTIRISYTATSGVGFVQKLVEVTGACEASDTSAVWMKPTINDSVYIMLPRSCIVGAGLSVRIAVFDGALEAAVYEFITDLTVADLTAPTVAPSFVPRAAADGTPHPESVYFVGDTLDVYFNAVDNIGVAALVWEVIGTGVRDSIPVTSAPPRMLRIPIGASWGSAPVRLRLYAWDRAGRMSNVYTSPHDIRVHPTIVRPVRSTGVDGGIEGLAIDSERGIAYFRQVDNQRVAIFSLAAMSVTGYVNLGTHLGDLDLTPGGDSLIVTLPTQRALAVVDLSGASPVVSTIPMTVLDPVIKDLPIRVRVLGGGRVLVGLDGTAQATRRVAELNLTTGAQRMLPEPPFGGGGVFERSHDRSTVIFRGMQDHLQFYDAVADQFGATRTVPAMWFETRPSMDVTGSRIAFGSEVFDDALNVVTRPIPLPNMGVTPNVISPDGEILYASSYRDGITRYRVSDGALLDRTPNPVRPGVLRVTADGKWLITHGIGGISVIDLR